MVYALLAALAACATANACSVPVFRYALERWAADPFQVAVLHRGELTDDDAKAFIQALEAASEAEPNYANVSVSPVNLDEPLPKMLEEALTDEDRAATAPLAVAIYPYNPIVAWRGTPTASAAAQLLDSPLRRTIAREILKGASAVWVLVESGDQEKDDAALALLRENLKTMEGELELPDVTPMDREQYMTGEGPELSLSFSVVQLKKGDAEEAAFRSMLLNSEELPEEPGPIAYPLFGQGRCLAAFHGDMLKLEEMGAACAFLVGMCSCQVKAYNPGVDMLFSAGWGYYIFDNYVVDETLPELMSTAMVLPETQEEGEIDASELSQSDVQSETEPASDASSGSGGSSRLSVTVLLTVAASAAGIAIASAILRKRGEG